MYEVTDNGVLKNIESWMLFIPAKDNDGKPFSPAVIDEVLQEILLSFPGLTVTSTVGYWKERSEIYEDQNYEVVIDTVPDPELLVGNVDSFPTSAILATVESN